MELVQWNAARKEDGTWHVVCTYPNRDGAGSASVADIGSALACDTFVKLVADYLANGGRVKDITRPLVERWIAAGCAANIVCTIKFQGETDHQSAASFAAIPGAQVLHLHHNKHELTFMLSSPPGT